MTGWTIHRIGEEDPGIGVTVHRLVAPAPGPRLLVLGGVHGNEIGGIVGAGVVTQQPLVLSRGALDVVPITHEVANAEFVRCGPADGLDLARTFPGDRHGSPTQRLAALLLAELITPANAIIDLHTSSPDADLPFFAGSLDDGTPTATRGIEMASAFGTGTVWSHPTLGPGRTLTMAAELGIPAMYVESPTGGVLDPQLLSAYADGVVRVCGLLGMLPATAVPDAPATRLWLHGSGDTDGFSPAPCAGYFLAEVLMLQQVSEGERLGQLLDAYGHQLREIRALNSGVVTYLRRQAKVTEGTPLASVNHHSHSAPDRSDPDSHPEEIIPHEHPRADANSRCDRPDGDTAEP